MAASPKWQFKTKFRANAYGWRGSKLAITRLKEAVTEIRTAAKSDPVAAGDGCVALMERLWPALQHIDTSSGALGTAVYKALEDLNPKFCVEDQSVKFRYSVKPTTGNQALSGRLSNRLLARKGAVSGSCGDISRRVKRFGQPPLTDFSAPLPGALP